MAGEIEWFVGIDWASRSHQICLVDAHGECLGERAVAHGGAGIEHGFDRMRRVGVTLTEMTLDPVRSLLGGAWTVSAVTTVQNLQCQQIINDQ